MLQVLALAVVSLRQRSTPKSVLIAVLGATLGFLLTIVVVKGDDQAGPDLAQPQRELPPAGPIAPETAESKVEPTGDMVDLAGRGEPPPIEVSTPKDCDPGDARVLELPVDPGLRVDTLAALLQIKQPNACERIAIQELLELDTLYALPDSLLATFLESVHCRLDWIIGLHDRDRRHMSAEILYRALHAASCVPTAEDVRRAYITWMVGLPSDQAMMNILALACRLQDDSSTSGLELVLYTSTGIDRSRWYSVILRELDQPCGGTARMTAVVAMVRLAHSGDSAARSWLENYTESSLDLVARPTPLTTQEEADVQMGLCRVTDLMEGSAALDEKVIRVSTCASPILRKLACETMRTLCRQLPMGDSRRARLIAALTDRLTDDSPQVAIGAAAFLRDHTENWPDVFRAVMPAAAPQVRRSLERMVHLQSHAVPTGAENQ